MSALHMPIVLVGGLKVGINLRVTVFRLSIRVLTEH
jgi:hypothetical protein